MSTTEPQEKRGTMSTKISVTLQGSNNYTQTFNTKYYDVERQNEGLLITEFNKLGRHFVSPCRIFWPWQMIISITYINEEEDDNSTG